MGLWKGTMTLKQLNMRDLVAVLEVAVGAVCAAGATVVGPGWPTRPLVTLGTKPVVSSVETLT